MTDLSQLQALPPEMTALSPQADGLSRLSSARYSVTGARASSLTVSRLPPGCGTADRAWISTGPVLKALPAACSRRLHSAFAMHMSCLRYERHPRTPHPPTWGATRRDSTFVCLHKGPPQPFALHQTIADAQKLSYTQKPLLQPTTIVCSSGTSSSTPMATRKLFARAYEVWVPSAAVRQVSGGSDRPQGPPRNLHL